MGAILNGMSLSKVRPYGSGFLIFSDYGRGSLRLGAIMELPVIYVFTHDSIGVGEDGPTHQPVEHLASLRAIPGLLTIRPGDANEVAEAWRLILQLRHEPAALILSRQALPMLDRSRYAPAAGLQRGAYVLADAPGAAPEVLLLGTGSEVSLCVAAHEDAAGARGAQPRRQHAELGDLRKAAAGLSRRRAAAAGNGTRLGGAGLDIRLGALRRQRRAQDRDAHLRRLGAAEGAAGQVRVRACPGRGRGA